MGDPVSASFLTASIAELRSLKGQAEKALAQVTADERLDFQPDLESNSLSVLIRHLAGNMVSRWTDFLTTDGEKPTRDRDGEFAPDARPSRRELMHAWEKGWTCLFGALGSLAPADLAKTVRIRGEEMTVVAAIQRSLAHYAAHVGQMVYLAKHLEHERWTSLSIPRRTPGAARDAATATLPDDPRPV